jgi:hypothetical protein
MQRYTVYLYPETALIFSGGISTHHQERIQLYLQRLVFVTVVTFIDITCKGKCEGNVVSGNVMKAYRGVVLELHSFFTQILH